MSRTVNPVEVEQFMNAVTQSPVFALLLDYDGTLAPLRLNRQQAPLSRNDRTPAGCTMITQVKVNGFRIELGEVESALLSCPMVKAAAAVVHEEVPIGKRVVAYVETDNQTEPVKRKIRDFLAQKLPDYLIPRHFILLPVLPLTPSGKLDRRRLPSPEDFREGERIPPTAPRNEAEHKLLEIWKELLGKSAIGTDQDFFDLGGTSLLLIRLLAKVEKAFGGKLDVAAIFEAPTIRELALRIRAIDPNLQTRRIFPLKSVGALPPFFCVGAGAFIRPLAKLMGPDQPFLGLGLSHEDKKWLKLSCSLGEIAERLVISLRQCQPEGPYYIGGWCHDGVMAYEIAQHLREQGETVSLLALFDCQNPAWGEEQAANGGVRRRLSKIKYLLATTFSTLVFFQTIDFHLQHETDSLHICFSAKTPPKANLAGGDSALHREQR